MRRAPALAAFAISLAALLGTAGATRADGESQPDERLRIHDLRVFGGENAWHADAAFRLVWDKPQTPSVAIDYLVTDAAGEVVVPRVRVLDGGTTLEPVEVPPVAGEYTVTVWLESRDGEGPRSRATLRFDDTRPAPVRPLPPPGWIKAGGDVAIGIEHPAAPWPLSGVRGYAVVVDHGGGAQPCARPDRCGDAEVDLPGGAADDWISLGAMEEGVDIVRVVAVSGSGMPSGSVGSAELRVDGSRPEVELDPVAGGWSDRPVTVRALASDELSGMEPGEGSNAFTALAIDGGPPLVTPGGAALATVHGDGIHLVVASARDAAGNATWEGRAAPGRTAIVRIDETPPQVAFSRSQDPTEPERIEALVADPLSGPNASRGSIAVRPQGSTQPFEPIPTEVSGDRLVAIWDSDAYPPGRYEFRASAYDAAGNRAESERRESGGAMELASPLKAAVQIQFGFGGRRLTAQRCERRGGRVRCSRREIGSVDRRPARARVRFGRRVPVVGRLTSDSGAPLPGLPVSVLETFPGGGPEPRATTVVTAADGSFSARLAPGPSRRVEVAFAGGRLLSRAGGRTLRLAVAEAVRLRTSAPVARVGGAPIRFSGAVLPAPTSGRPVELQFRLAGQPWSEFRTVETDSRGHFHYSYAFSDDDSRGVGFQFRAAAAHQSGWPYAPGVSLPVLVRGR